MSYNTLQAAWARIHQTRPEALPESALEVVQTAFYMGGLATLRIVRDAAGRDRAAFNAILEGLRSEAEQFMESLHGPEAPPHRRDDGPLSGTLGLTTFRIPLVGAGPEVAKRIEFAIPLAKAAAVKEGCPALCAYLLEAIQHALVFGVSREEIADDVKDNADWWHKRMHAGVNPEAAAREARGELKEGA
jgi:hypothetical protein